jgi:hypothetical protein
MIEEEIFGEIHEEQTRKCEEPYLFPKEEMDSMIKWSPVSNIPVDEIYKDLPEVKRFHESYTKTWLTNKGKEL